MVGMTLAEPHRGPMTVADLAGLPDDGRRFELIDGMLFVSPAPRPRHQGVVGELLTRLRAVEPAGLRVMVGPLDVRLDDATNLQPDLLVARTDDFAERDLPVAPLLAVEVLSPSTRLYDLHTKRAAYEAAGCASYWVVDPDEPSLTAWELVEGRYVEVAHVVGEDRWAARAPYPVTLAPRDLVRD